MNDFKSIEHHIEVLNTLKAPTGLFLASTDETTGYNKAWLRDNFYMALGYEAVGDWETVQKMYRAILDLFLKHKEKINWAAHNKPHETWQYIHARFDPETFEEYWEEWGNKQNDSIGALLFKIGQLEQNGYGIVKNDEDKWLIRHLVKYLDSIEYWQDRDNGVWEENEEVHTSSVGAVVAGLTKLREVNLGEVPDDLIRKGQVTLNNTLPRESEGKFVDLAQLSLIYPYNVIGEEHRNVILTNVVYHLERTKGVVRYKNDYYYNKNNDGHSEEAEWTFGFPWLSIIYAELGETDKALAYFKKSQSTITKNGTIPELYYSNTTQQNENDPLGWSESLYIVAYVKLKQLGLIT